MGTLSLSLVPIHIHCVHVETLCCTSLDWGGHSLLQIFLMTQSLDASVSNLMYVRLIRKSVPLMQSSIFSFCATVLNSTRWNSFLTSCPLCLLVELLLYVQCIFIFWYYYCWTVKSVGYCQRVPPVHKVSLLSFFLVSGLALLCHHMVAYHPCPQRSRETGTVFQSLKLIQTVSHSC